MEMKKEEIQGNEEGATMLEYVLLAAFLVIGMIAVILGLRGTLSQTLSGVGSAVTTQGG